MDGEGGGWGVAGEAGVRHCACGVLRSHAAGDQPNKQSKNSKNLTTPSTVLPTPSLLANAACVVVPQPESMAMREPSVSTDLYEATTRDGADVQWTDCSRAVHAGTPSDTSSVLPYADVLYYRAVGEGIARISINRPECHNAFRPRTVMELRDALRRARDDGDVGAIIMAGEGGRAFSTGGDQRA